jgi:hypothetical protein
MYRNRLMLNGCWAFLVVDTLPWDLRPDILNFQDCSSRYDRWKLAFPPPLPPPRHITIVRFSGGDTAVISNVLKLLELRPLYLRVYCTSGQHMTASRPSKTLKRQPLYQASSILARMRFPVWWLPYPNISIVPSHSKIRPAINRT